MADHYTLLKSQVEVAYYQNQNFAITLFQVFLTRNDIIFSTVLICIIIILFIVGLSYLFKDCWQEL